VKERPLTDDLSALSRRGAASPSEERRLEMLLRASPVERFLDAFGRDCDAVPLSLPGDAALLARAVDRVQPAPRRRRWRRGAATAVAVAAVTLASTVAAAFAIPQWRSVPPAAPSGGERCAAVAPAPLAPPRGATAPETTAEPAATPPVPSAPAAAAAPLAVPAAGPPAPGALTAAEAFARANALRRAGQGPAAVAGYWQLQRDHPRSAEALLSHVLLGRLLLQQGSAVAAGDQFARYLRAAPSGSLAEEALFGRASALRASGRTGEERHTLQQLVTRFPGSVSARAARTRLAELD